MLVNVFRQYEGKDGKAAVYAKAWPKNLFRDTKPVADVMELSEALTRGFRYPAYLVGYAPTKGNRRLSVHILGSEKPLAYVGGSVTMQLALFDVDGPKHSTGGEGVEAWFEEELPKIEQLLLAHPGLFIYRSRGGYRIIGLLPRPFALSSEAGADVWTRKYVSWCNYLSRAFRIKSHGKDGPDKLADWTRLQRVPHDSRDFSTPDQLEVIGDASNVGVWDPKVDASDIPEDVKARRAQPQMHDVAVGNMLLQLVRQRGLRCEDGGAGEYDICCPRWERHSPNESGDRDYEGKTRLYTGQGKLGGIKCFSDGCTALHPTPGHWMDEFDWQEKLQARRALGLTTVGDSEATTYDDLVRAKVHINAIGVLLEGKDDSKPDKTVQQCIHQAASSMLRAGLRPEQILGVLTSEEFALSEHVLQQTDPGWYFLETLARAQDAIAQEQEEKRTKESPAPEAQHDAHEEILMSIVETTEQVYHERFSFLSRDIDTAFGDSDQALATMAVACLGRRTCRRIEHQGDWLNWNGHCWQLGEAGRVRLLLKELCAVIKRDCRDTSAGLHGAGRNTVVEAFERRHPHYGGKEDVETRIDKELATMRSMTGKLESTAGLNAVITLIGDALSVSLDDLDNNEDQVVFRNTTWHASTGEFKPARQEDLATRCIEMDWKGLIPSAQHRWSDYLASLGFDDETLQFLQRSFGYAMLGRGNEKRFWWFRGETGVSKSTVIELVAECMGGYTNTSPVDLWLVKGGSRPGHTDDLAALRGARMVIADEFPKICRFDDALMKRCTSGVGKLRVSAKGKSGFAFKPRFAMFFASNFDPQIAEDDEALLSRLTTFTFKVRIAESQKNVRFAAEFLAHEGQRAAILAWVMQGARDYIRHGLGKEPTQVKSSRAEFLEGQVSVEDQLAELIRPEKGSSLSMTAIMERLTELQHRTRQRAPFTMPQIANALRKRFNASCHSKSGVKLFHDIALRDSRLRNQASDPSQDPDPDFEHSSFEAPGF